MVSTSEKQRQLTAARVRDDMGPNGYWARKEAGKKDWAALRRKGALREQKRALEGRIEEVAEQRRREEALKLYNAAVQRDIDNGAI